MKRNYLAGFMVSAAVLGLLAFAAWNLFEIRPVMKYDPPSRETRVNHYFVLDRWLAGMGIPVRVERQGNLSTISRAEEKHIFIQASLFKWTEEAAEYLANWVEEGGSLFLALDYGEEWGYDTENLSSVLREFEIEITEEPPEPTYDYDSPDYDHDISFAIRGGAPLLLKDRNGAIKLAQIKRGRGKVTVTGRPFFLQNVFIDDWYNTRLAWTFFASGVDESGWLFIRGTTRVGGLVGSLFRHGNFAVIIAAGLVLLVVGFWSVIPMFGLVRPDDEKPGKPLRERFLAEGRFLKKYGALGVYSGAYVREIRRRLARNEGITADGEIERRVLEIWGNADGQLIRVMRGESVGKNEFPKLIVILETILERL